MDLVLENVTKSFGGLRAASDVSFTVPSKVIFGLIGPNGAGKTTVFNLVTGIYKPDSGSIRFGSTELSALRPAQIAGAGIGRTFQNIRLFGQLTVIENLLVACELQKKAHLAAAVVRAPVHYQDEREMHERALELLRVFDLDDMADDAPTTLSYGNQRRLEIARAMMLKPSLLLLDEPAAGMNYGEAEGLKTQIRWLRDTFDLTVVLVEHNMQVVMGVCEELHVLDHGETIAHGTPDEIRVHPKVLAAYLGEEEGAPAVRAAVEEASGQELPSVVESGPQIGAESRPEMGDESRPPIVEVPARAPEKLTQPELESLSKALREQLERELSRPDDAPRAREEEGAQGEEANIDAVEIAAAPTRPSHASAAVPEGHTSTPDVGALDSGWGDDDPSSGEDSTTHERTNRVRKKDVN